MSLLVVVCPLYAPTVPLNLGYRDRNNMFIDDYFQRDGSQELEKDIPEL